MPYIPHVEPILSQFADGFPYLFRESAPLLSFREKRRDHARKSGPQCCVEQSGAPVRFREIDDRVRRLNSC
jgi:hypothetical protein